MRALSRRSKRRAGTPAEDTAGRSPASTPSVPPASDADTAGAGGNGRTAAGRADAPDCATTPPTAPDGAGEATRPPDRQAAERARRMAALRRMQEQRRARAGLARSRSRRPPRPRFALLALVVTLGVMITAVAVTGTLIATSREPEPIALAAPLHVYPVTQVVSGACPAGTQGITGNTTAGPVCYQLNSGIAIRRVTKVQVQPGQTAGTYDVAIDLISADRRAFGELTRLTVGRTVAFVVRGELVTAPRVDMPITDGKVVVTGRFGKPEADRLARVLKGS